MSNGAVKAAPFFAVRGREGETETWRETGEREGGKERELPVSEAWAPGLLFWLL